MWHSDSYILLPLGPGQYKFSFAPQRVHSSVLPYSTLNVQWLSNTCSGTQLYKALFPPGSSSENRVVPGGEVVQKPDPIFSIDLLVVLQPKLHLHNQKKASEPVLWNPISWAEWPCTRIKFSCIGSALNQGLSLSEDRLQANTTCPKHNLEAFMRERNRIWHRRIPRWPRSISSRYPRSPGGPFSYGYT